MRLTPVKRTPGTGENPCGQVMRENDDVDSDALKIPASGIIPENGAGTLEKKSCKFSWIGLEYLIKRVFARREC
jgi:hypothetical protein